MPKARPGLDEPPKAVLSIPVKLEANGFLMAKVRYLPDMTGQKRGSSEAKAPLALRRNQIGGWHGASLDSWEACILPAKMRLPASESGLSHNLVWRVQVHTLVRPE